MIVLGSTNMDIVYRVSRAPSAGETVMGTGYASYPGGKGANQAVAAKRAGADVQFVSCLGRDDYGDFLEETLRREGIGMQELGRSELPTGVAFILLENNGQNRITIIPGANRDIQPKQLIHLFQAPDVLLMQLEISVDIALRAATRMRSVGGVVILNASPVQTGLEALLALTDMLLVNETEARHLLARSAPIHADNALQMVQQLGAGRQAAVITLGAAGAVWANAQGDFGHVPGFPVKVVDTTGCGDAFAGVFSAAVAAGASIKNAVVRGNAAGALAATCEGAQSSLPLRTVIEDFLAHHLHPNPTNNMRARP